MRGSRFYVPLLLLACAPALAQKGLARRFRHDHGIAQHPHVVMADAFEGWREPQTFPDDTWTALRKNAVSRTAVVPGRVVWGGRKLAGRQVLRIACWRGPKGNETGGLSRKLGNYNHGNERLGDGEDEVYVRYYMRLSANYRGVRNHGNNLGGRDVTRKGSRWVGMANTTDVAAQGYFFSGLQPYGKDDALTLGFYSYHCDKPGKWGDVRKAEKVSLRPGVWYCVERRMKLNSAPEVKDGVEELWVDGRKVISWTGLRFRKVMHLKITFFSLETYYHGLPEDFTEQAPIAMDVDHVVIARSYIGPVRAR